MRVQKIFAVMGEAPFGKDRAAARYDPGDPLRRQRNVRKPHAGMDGEIVDALLALLDERVAIDVPAQLLGNAADFLERLVDRHRSDRHRCIANDPFADGVDVPAGRKVHHRVGAPADRPDELFHFLRCAGRHDGVADVGVHLGQEIAADDHRLGFGMIDVGGDDGAPARHFAPYELRRDPVGNGSAEAFAVARHRAAEIFARRDELHLLGDDALARVMQLRDFPSRFCAQHLAAAAVELRHGEQLAALQTVVLGSPCPALAFLDVAAGKNPVAPSRRKSSFDVDRNRLVRVRAGSIVKADRRFATRERHLAERHAVYVQFSRPWQLPARHHVVGDGPWIQKRLLHGFLSLRRC